MAEKVAAQSFVTDMGKYTSVSMADSMSTPGSAGSAAASGMGMAMGMQMAAQMMGQMGQMTQPQAAQPQQAACVCASCGYASPTQVKFCPQCGKPMGQPQPAGDRFGSA